jgi:hypothetical protein
MKSKDHQAGGIADAQGDSSVSNDAGARAQQLESEYEKHRADCLLCRPWRLGQWEGSAHTRCERGWDLAMEWWGATR